MRVVTFDAARRLRWRVASVAAVMVLFVVAGPVAEAKMPPFEIDVEVDGTTATITVVIDDQYGFEAADLDGLLAVYPESGLDDRLRPESQSVAIEVGLDRAGTGLYRGTIDLKRAGRWAVVPFPTSAEYDPFQLFYPDTIMFETTANSARLWVAGVGFGSAALLIVGGRSRKLRWLPRPVAVATVVGIVVSMTVVAMAATTPGGGAFECPVTIPSEPGFVPQDTDQAEPSIDDRVWYGSEDLWTVLSTDGSYPPRKSVWWSQDFPGGRLENTPPIEVTWQRLDADRPPITADRGTNAHTPEDGWFMIARIDPDEPGCWKVTATYKGAELSYVYQIP